MIERREELVKTMADTLERYIGECAGVWHFDTAAELLLRVVGTSDEAYAYEKGKLEGAIEEWKRARAAIEGLPTHDDLGGCWVSQAAVLAVIDKRDTNAR